MIAEIIFQKTLRNFVVKQIIKNTTVLNNILQVIVR